MLFFMLQVKKYIISFNCVLLQNFVNIINIQYVDL